MIDGVLSVVDRRGWPASPNPVVLPEGAGASGQADRRH